MKLALEAWKALGEDTYGYGNSAYSMRLNFFRCCGYCSTAARCARES
jgi:hypothetical protein